MDGRKELKFLLDSRMLFQIEKRISCAMSASSGVGQYLWNSASSKSGRSAMIAATFPEGFGCLSFHRKQPDPQPDPRIRIHITIKPINQAIRTVLPIMQSQVPQREYEDFSMRNNW